MEIQGKVAIVTGAGSGIGQATAKMLAAKGAQVLAADIDEPAAKATVVAIEKAGGKAVAIKADISTIEGIRTIFAAAERTFGGVDIVYNNAGISTGDPGWPESSLEDIYKQVNINVSGVMMGTQAAVQAMRKRGGGAIINTASTAALHPLPFDPVYAGTKAAVLLFTQSCAKLKETDNIRVNTVLPGMTKTNFQRKTGDGVKAAAWLQPAIDRTGDKILPPEAIGQAVIDFIEDESKAGEQRVVSPQV